MTNALDGELQHPGVGDHGVVAPIIGHHDKMGSGVSGRYITQIKREVKVQRVGAFAGAGYQRHPAMDGGQLPRLPGLMRAVEEPDIGEARRKRGKFFERGLNVLKVHQCVQFFHPESLIKRGSSPRAIFAGSYFLDSGSATYN